MLIRLGELRFWMTLHPMSIAMNSLFLMNMYIHVHNEAFTYTYAKIMVGGNDAQFDQSVL